MVVYQIVVHGFSYFAKKMIYYVFDLSFRNLHGFVSNCVA
jgi:hypothetical protein